MEITDKELFDKVVKGNQAAFEKIFRKYYTSLCIHANRLVRNMDVAEEIVQDIFLHVWENRASLRITISLSAYLHRSVHNSSLNHLKHKKVRDKYEQYVLVKRSNQDSTKDYVVAKELEQKIEEGINQLPEQCKIIFCMNRFESLKYKEIAEKLSISIKTVEAQMGKALKILRNHVKEFLVLFFLFFL